MSLNHNEIKDVESTSALIKLVYLDLSFNHMYTMDVSQLSKLQELKIGKNHITQINLNLLYSLNTLEINDNCITEIDFNKLSNLKQLNVSNNKDIVINNIEALKNIEHIEASNIGISEIKNFRLLENIEFLDLSKNSIINPYAIIGLNKIKYLDLSYNRLERYWQLLNLPKYCKIIIDSNNIDIRDVKSFYGVLNQLTTGCIICKQHAQLFKDELISIYDYHTMSACIMKWLNNTLEWENDYISFDNKTTFGITPKSDEFLSYFGIHPHYYWFHNLTLSQINAVIRLYDTYFEGMYETDSIEDILKMPEKLAIEMKEDEFKQYILKNINLDCVDEEVVYFN